MSDGIRLIIDGDAYSGWDYISVRRSLDEAIHSIQLGVLDKWDSSDLPRVRNGSPFQVQLDGELITTGYLDQVHRQYDGEQRSVTIQARSKAQDMQDCAYPLDKLPSSWKKQTVLQISNYLAKPFGITVTDSSGLASQKVEIAKVRQGDTPFDIINAYMRVIGARIISLPSGNLNIVSPSKDRLTTAIKLGENVEKADDTSDLRDRFSDYRVVSQHKGDDFTAPGDSASIVGKAHDAVMAKLRYRPTTINASTMLSSQEEANKLAKVDRNVAAGHSHKTVYTLNGWHHKKGIWAPNHQVHVVDPISGWNDWLMIGTVELVSDTQGKRAEITVMPVTAYDITAEPADTLMGMW